MTKTDTVLDLLARALGLNIPDDIDRLKGYCELYSSAKTIDDRLEHTLIIGNVRYTPFSATEEVPEPEDPTVLTDTVNPVSEPTKPVIGNPISEGSEPAPPPDKPYSFLGKGASDKQEIHNRLQTYRSNSGIGWATKISEASKGKLTTSAIRDMLNCGKHPLAEWVLLKRALDKVEGVKESEGT